MSGRRVCVTGGRDFDDAALVRKAFEEIGLRGGDTLVHGCCKGADLLCDRIARNEYGARSEAHPADWYRHGKAAGPIRNREMLGSGIDVLLAFPGGRGTENCVATAIRMEIEVKRYG